MYLSVWIIFISSFFILFLFSPQTQTEAVSAPDICIASCNFIKFIKNAKIGVCPSTFGGFAEACVNECEDDQGCNGEKKCCDNGCGRTCQVPNIRKKGKIREGSDQGSSGTGTLESWTAHVLAATAIPSISYTNGNSQHQPWATKDCTWPLP